jgi:uncharacterized membrane protein YcaP (DUF421 family)
VVWHDIFVAGVPLLERVVRAALIYVFAVVALRVAGKRELGQLSTFDLVVLLFFSNILQNAVIGADNSVTGGVVGAATFLALNYLVARVTYRHERLSLLVEGKPTILIADGVVQTANLRRELVSVDELKAACHRQGIRELADVDMAVLDPDGAIAVFGRTQRDDMHERLKQLQASVDALTARLAAGEQLSG